MGPLNLLRPANIISPPSFVATVALSTNQAQIDPIPFCQVMAFAATANFGVAFGSTNAVFPAATTTAASSSQITEINPTIRHVNSTQVTTGITVIGTTAGGFLSVSMFSRGG